MRGRLFRILIPGIIAVFYSCFSYAQINNHGLPQVTNYAQSTYNSFPQNWCAFQDARGVMYFANQNCILEYDGRYWKRIFPSDNIFLRSLEADNAGVIYYGTANGFGYLEPDESGMLIPHTLSDTNVLKNNLVSDFWKIIAINDDIYFFSEYSLFRYNKSTASFNVWDLKFDIFQVFHYANTLYLSSYSRGLIKMEGDSLTDISGGDYFADKAIIALLPFKNDSLYIVTYDQGIYKAGFDNTRLIAEPVNNELNVKLKDKLIYCAVMAGSDIAVGTVGEGIFFINGRGELLQVINEYYGLSSNNIANLLYAKNGQETGILWATTDKGITKIECSSPLTQYDSKQGLTGLITDVVSFKGLFYVSSLDGLFYKTTNERGLTKFTKVETLKTGVWKLVIVKAGEEEHLVACTEHNLYEITGLKCKQLTQLYSTIMLYQLKSNPSLAMICLDKGYAKLSVSSSGFEDLGVLQNTGVSCRIPYVTEDKNGKLWLLTLQDGVIHFDFTSEKIIKSYNKSSDTALSSVYCMFNYGDGLYIGTHNGIYQYNEKKDTFELSSILGNDSTAHKLELLRIKMYKNDMAWGVVKQKDKKYVCRIDFKNKKVDINSYKRILEQNIWGFYMSDERYTYIYSTDKLYLYNNNYKRKNDDTYHALIRKVSLNTDSVIFNGTFYKTDSITSKRVMTMEQLPSTVMDIAYSYNNISFEWAAPFFEAEEETEYSYFLEGNDEGWSEWSKRSDKEYTNLFEGSYAFHVKARNVYGTESSIATYHFAVLSPWYRTLWAYLAYFVLFVLFVLGIVKLSVYRLQKINEAYGKYLPGSFLKMLDKRRVIDFRLGDMAEKEMTIMFSDIRSYTKLSESMTPHDNFRFLVRYLRHIGEVFHKNKGFPVQYYGDGVMAMFQGKTDNSVQATIDMHRRVAEYSVERLKKGRSEIKIGIGLHTGKVIMGIRGDAWRWEGGIVGDAVNIASRIEGLTKIFGAVTIISEDVYLRIEKPQQFHFRFLGKVKVKGKNQIIKVYELLDGLPEDIFNVKMQIVPDFSKANELFESEKFDEALTLFEHICTVYDDLASKYYINVINSIKEKPQCHFDGALVIDIK